MYSLHQQIIENNWIKHPIQNMYSTLNTIIAQFNAIRHFIFISIGLLTNFYIINKYLFYQIQKILSSKKKKKENHLESYHPEETLGHFVFLKNTLFQYIRSGLSSKDHIFYLDRSSCAKEMSLRFMNHNHQDLTMWTPKEKLDRTSASSISKHKIKFQVVSLS